MSASQDTMQRRLLNRSEYYRMAEIGILAPGERVELIEGEIIDMAPIGSKHSSAVKRMNRQLVKACDGRAIVQVQDPIVLSDLSEPEPDFALLRLREDYYENALPHAADVLLVIEVAVSTLRYDRDIKIPLYARHGIPEVWLIDVAGSELTMYRGASDHGYEHQQVVDNLQKVGFSGLEGVSVDLTGLF